VNGKRLVFFGDGQGYIHAFEAPDKFIESKKLAKLKEVWVCDANPHEYRYDENGRHRIYQKDTDNINFKMNKVGHFSLKYRSRCRDQTHLGISKFIHEGFIYNCLNILIRDLLKR
jgi:hypothetical protein